MMEITGKHNIIQGSQLLVAVTPEKGFFTKSRKRYTSQKDGKEHSKFLWTPETVRDIWVTCDDKMYQIHFMVANSDGSVRQVSQSITKQQYDQYVGYKFDKSRIELMEKILHRNRIGLQIRKWTADRKVSLKLTDRLFNELSDSAEKCRMNFNQYCTKLLSNKQPRSALTDDEKALLMNLKKVRGDVLFQFNAMVAEFAHMTDAERMRVVIHGKSYAWWREYLISLLEFLDKEIQYHLSNL